MTAGEGVRQLIAAAIDDDADGRPGASDPGLARPVVGEPRSRIEIRLTMTELEAVEQRASAMGLSGNRWIVSLVRAQLAREPQLGEHEMQALSESNRQLAGISRLLGQFARSGMAWTVRENWTADWLEIRSRIDAHLRATAAVIRTSLDRWSR
ncbi:plasmid stabilization protein [Paraburkholderia saeva]|uniref:plasmid stabilization protein n=1 Tax=Paraburkholderia saeva TaxID=2777537 RepID=UPI002B4B9E25|nr:plasmid stabilization protein [Paraburkholderia saeva]